MDRDAGMILSRAARARPHPAVALGALGIATSGIFIHLSGTSPGTATFFRCALALPLLWPLARGERRRTGGLSWRNCAAAAAAGTFFAADAMLWTQAILEVGAGVTAVLVNTQVIIVPLLSSLVDRERLGRSFPVIVGCMATGIVLTGGILGTGVSGDAPARGTVHAVLAALCYSGFLFLLRRGGRTEGVLRSYCGVLISAAAVSVIGGVLWRGVTVTPGWGALGWLALTAVCGQVGGWLLVALATSRLSSTVSSALLMLTPVGALLLGALVLGERPTLPQLLGCALILASAYAASASGSFHRRFTSTGGKPRDSASWTDRAEQPDRNNLP
ncbi:Permease of the drug/metabolite transporter (DMT) superfamily [Actinopolyspora alba]|uniref:Permease of the drug/metabolite transporter (DMT) superfamily n=1 Tax=Actinopolyspora alba TaxID=673379 RepID=A0A1I1X179_9ACTN|nr:DMT family transporter [Actinopolyspora alba]SFE01107.1 Permease of the drug/metabolite transporter (DMT) superfamily [Actinopolyspora alba]